MLHSFRLQLPKAAVLEGLLARSLKPTESAVVTPPLAADRMRYCNLRTREGSLRMRVAR